MKKIIHYIHLILGLTSGSIVFIVALSGCFVSFEEDLRKALNADLFYVNKSSSSVKSVDEILSIRSTFLTKEKLQGIRIPAAENESYELLFKGKKSVFIDPYTGKKLGELHKGDDFFGKMLRIHRNLFLDDLGEWITGISCLIFLFMILSGIVLWWPTSKKNGQEKFKLKWNLHPVKRNYDLHSVLGFYASWLILFTVLTGLIFSFKWAENTLFFVTGSKKEKRMEIASKSSSAENTYKINTIFGLAKKEFPNYSDCFIGLPDDKTGSVRISMRYKNGGFYRRIDNSYYDQYDGALLKVKNFDNLSTGTKLRITAENIHTGKSFGLIGQCIVFFASLICASLPITGFFIWWNKRK